MTDLTRESLAAALTTIRGAHNGPDDEPGQPPCEWCQLAADQAVQALAALPSPAPEPPPDGECWFCGDTAVLIAGHDDWDEQRLACLPCDERLRAIARHRFLIIHRDKDSWRAAQPAPDPELLKKIRVHLDDWNNGADPDICMQRIGEVVLQARESGGEPPNG